MTVRQAEPMEGPPIAAPHGATVTHETPPRPTWAGGPAQATRWRSWDAHRGEAGPIHVRRDRPDGSKVVTWIHVDGTPGLGGHELSNLIYLTGRARDALRQYWAPGFLVIAEGERSADAIAAAGMAGVGTVCGAAATPGLEVIRLLARYPVVVWPDADLVGMGHADRIGRFLEGIGVPSLAIVRPPAGVAPRLGRGGRDAGGGSRARRSGGRQADRAGDAMGALMRPEDLDEPLPLDQLDEPAEDGSEHEDAPTPIVRSRPSWHDGPPDDVPLLGELPPAAALIVGIDDYRAAVPAAVEWVVAHLAYLGGVTLISGPPKCGKSTLASQIQRSRETGAPLVGAWDVAVGPTLLLTEEGGVPVVYKTGGLHELEVLDRRTVVNAGLTFAQVLAVIGEWGSTHAGGLVFIDTLAVWAEVDDENDATAMTRALGAIAVVAQTSNLAVIVIHHTRKAGGEDGAAIRGSGAILASVDISIELSRAKAADDDDRNLDLLGRVILPDRYRLAFDRATMTYALADREEANLAEIEADLVGIPPDGAGLTRSELQAVWKRDPRKRAEQLVNVGRMRSEYVKAGRGWGYRYWSIPAVARASWSPPIAGDDD